MLGQRWQPAQQEHDFFWEQVVSTAAFPYLADHIVRESVVFPATAYVELVMAALHATFGAGTHAVEQVAFQKVLILREGSDYQLQVGFTQTDHGMRFQIASRPADDPQEPWTLHATGLALARPGTLITAPAPRAIAELQARCSGELSSDQVYAVMHGLGFAYGRCFRGVSSARYHAGQALGAIQLAERVQAECSRYHVHPSLLDISFHVLAAAETEGEVSEDETYLPVGIERVEVYAATDTTVWAHACMRPDPTLPAKTYRGDVFLLDSAGQVLAAAYGLCIQRLSHAEQRAAQDVIADWLYTVDWEEQPLPQVPESETAEDGTWLVFDHASGVGRVLTALLDDRAERSIRVTSGASYWRSGSEYRLNPTRLEDFERLLKDGFGAGQPRCRGIIFLWPLEDTLHLTPTLDELEAAQDGTTTGVLNLVQALVRTGWREEPRLWVVTRGTQAVGDMGQVTVAHGPLWGLSRVVAHEHPGLRCSCVDLGAAAPVLEAARLLDELRADTAEDQIALRGERRYVARLMRYTPEPVLAASATTIQIPAGDQPYLVELVRADGTHALNLRRAERRAPGAGEVELGVHAAGLRVSADTVQFDEQCSGVVLGVGVGVSGFSAGDEVIAVGVSALGSHMIVPAAVLIAKPAQLSFAQAADIGLDFTSLYAAMHHAALLRANPHGDASIASQEQQIGLMRQVVQLFATGTLVPQPGAAISIAEAQAAIPTLAHEPPHRVTVTFQQPDVLVDADLVPTCLDADASYLISGGTGGLGLATAQWMAAQGARHIVLTSRRGAPPEADAAAFAAAKAAIEAHGAELIVAKADIACADQVAAVLQLIAATLPPLRGIIHAAGVLDDGLLLQLNRARFQAVLRPKLHGAWNLHTQTRDIPLDFFVLFSSVAAMLGSPGQGNYCAANAFLDTLAHHRRAQGLPALSINWGPWAEVGMAAHLSHGGASGGLTAIAPALGVQALQRLMSQQAAQVAVMPLNLRQWRQFYPKAAKAPMFVNLLREDQQSSSGRESATSLRALLVAAALHERPAVMASYLREQISQVLRISSARIPIHASLGALGFDSLMALEFRNRLEDSTGLTLPATLIWNFPNITALGQHLAEKLDIALDAVAVPPVAEPAANALSADDRDELARVLGALGDLSLADLQGALVEE